VHAVTVETSTGQRHALVLRRWIDGEADWTRAAVERERVALVGLADSAVPAPRFVAASLGADTDGHPSLLMTRVRGRVNLEPKEPGDWLGQMAAALPPIHALGIDAAPAQLWRRVSDLRVPAWSTRPWLWREARELLAGPAPEGSSFIHADFQHFNLLWWRERLSGVVDWTMTGRGAPDRDVGHCRLNLAVLFSSAWAERFRLAYEAEAGRPIERWWDVSELCEYSDRWMSFIPIQVAGLTGVDVEGMHDRVEALLDMALKRP